MCPEQIDVGSSKLQEICASESKVNAETCQEPSTPQMKPNVDDVHSSANDLITILDADSECSVSSENLSVQQSVFTYGRNSSQIVQVKQEPMDCDETADFVTDRSRQNKSNEASMEYYRRKVFKKEKQESFQLDSLLDDWDDDGGQSKGQAKKDTPQSSDPSDKDDVISIASGATDSSFEFTSDPYIAEASSEQ